MAAHNRAGIDDRGRVRGRGWPGKRRHRYPLKFLTSKAEKKLRERRVDSTKESSTVRSKNENVTFLDHERIEDIKPADVSQLQRGVRRAHSKVAAMPPGRRASHPEYPLERVCSHLSEPFQLTFARTAQQHFLVREDVKVVASHQGLTIRAETEVAIDAAVVLLKDLYGPRIRIGPPTIRYHNGVTLEQPWMGLRVQCAALHLGVVNADLIDRNATIASCEIQTAMCLIQACAPLAALIGYRSDLEKLTAGSGQHAMWLSHYAPVENPPPGGQAA